MLLFPLTAVAACLCSCTVRTRHRPLLRRSALDQLAVAPEARYSSVSLCACVFRTPVNGVALDLDDFSQEGKICGVRKGKGFPDSLN